MSERAFRNLPSELFLDQRPQALTEEEERLKREIYEKLQPRRRTYIDRIGYENWDPFQKPKEPLDMRTDVGRRTVDQLLKAFLEEAGRHRNVDAAYGAAAAECALGMVTRNERYLAIFDFCCWYREMLEAEAGRRKPVA
ncbi:MAG: hypothetical protein LBR22_08030 [Desulfovibrio sp.]|jgi:hypothetical protein|nr:hypothetical protein [Desulfovibrio sp.]